MNSLYVEDVIVPIISIPDKDQSKFAFLGTGFYLDTTGYFITCKHVVEAIQEDCQLNIYQLGTKRTLKFDILSIHDKFDLALCKSKSPGQFNPWPIVNEEYVKVGVDIETYGYWHEPVGVDEIPFNTRYMKGYITGKTRSFPYNDSFELSFPVLFGISGSPLIYHSPVEGESRTKPCIAGCVYGSREAKVVKHSQEIDSSHTVETARITELGLAYVPDVLIEFISDYDIDIEIYD